MSIDYDEDDFMMVDDDGLWAVIVHKYRCVQIG